MSYGEITVTATIRYRVNTGGWRTFGPGDAVEVKRQAATALRAERFTRDMVRIRIELQQSSPQVTWLDGGTWWWRGAATPGAEYGAQWIEVWPTWGRGR